MKRVPVVIVDEVDPTVGADLLTKANAVAEACTVEFQQGRDWRPLAVRLLAQFLPSGWAYRGGSHVAAHASPPFQLKDRHGNPKPGHGQAGRRLFILAESRVSA